METQQRTNSICTVDSLYTSSANLYDAVYSEYYYKKKARQISDSIVTRDTTVFVDIGCGTGELQEKLAEKTDIKEIYGFDISPEMATLSSETNSGNIFVGDAETIPLKQESVDAVALVGDVIGYVKALADCFSELHRVLKKNGKVFLTYFSWPASEITNSVSGTTREGDFVTGTYEAKQIDEEEKAVEVTFTFENGGEITEVESTYLRCYTYETVKSELKKAGFSEASLKESYCTDQIDTVCASK